MKIILAIIPSIALTTGLSIIPSTSEKVAPALPYEFNATLLKIGPDPQASPIQFTKLYAHYDPHLKGGGFNRFDFFDHYYNLDSQWNIKCSIVFRDGVAYTVFPDDPVQNRKGECWKSHRNLPVVSPHFMQFGGEFEGYQLFRGVYAQKWRLGEVGDEDTIYFYFRADNQSLPLRSTNQANDPGATDWFDVMVGRQNLSVFDLPADCDHDPQPGHKYHGCPPDEDFKLLLQKS